MNSSYFEREGSSAIPYRRIGAGFCGSVWATPPDHEDVSTAELETIAIKRENGGPGRLLDNDSDVHQLLLRSIRGILFDINTFSIPKWYDFIPVEHRDWDDGKVLARFPNGYTPCNILMTERIPPMPEDIRHRIIDRYCPPSLISTIKADTNNDNCLVRPYLGRRRHGQGQRASRLQFFSLRNYPLHIDQMEELGLKPYMYAERMADALASMHWSAKIDANDVEFVLAPPCPSSQHQHLIEEPVLGRHCLWILDFDCCKPMTMDEPGLRQAAAAFWRNDPYYPRPGRGNGTDDKLWRS